MSLTANFDFCVELGIAEVRQIFHLAFKQEDRYPHNIGPLSRVLAGRQVTVHVRVHDDETRPADLRFQSEKTMVFSFPFDLTVETADAPDPSLSRVTLRAGVDIPAALAVWAENGEEVLGLDFTGVTAADVVITSLEGLPAISVDNFRAAIHRKYDSVPHTHGFAGNTLLLYDDTRDPSLDPPNNAVPFEIEAALEVHGGADFLRLTLPIHVNVVNVPVIGTYASYGRIMVRRPVSRTDTTISVNMGAEPADPALATRVELDSGPAAVRDAVITQLTPLAVNAINGFGTITEPAFSEAGARALLQEEIANYIRQRRFPVYSPQSGDPAQPLTTPVGFLLVGPEVLAILLNRRDPSVADHAPDNFLGTNQMALAVGRAKVDEIIGAAIDAEFPNVRHGGTDEVVTDEGSATLESLNVEPSDPGSHGQGPGHLWVTGEAEVHIDCWPDPDVSFEGPIFVVATREDTPEGDCGLKITPSAGDFDVDQSCCDVFLDLLIPVVGIIMLIIIENTIDEVGGELAGQIAAGQGRVIEPIPPVVNGIAEVTGCLTALNITSQGFIMPGELTIRRLDRSFEDLRGDRDLPGP